jgi:hypothetical protein
MPSKNSGSPRTPASTDRANSQVSLSCCQKYLNVFPGTSPSAEADVIEATDFFAYFSAHGKKCNDFVPVICQKKESSVYKPLRF